MKKLIVWLFLLTATWAIAQNDDCSGAIPLTVGTSFSSNAITSSNTGATTSGNTPFCNEDAADNVWFKVVVPPSGNLNIETREVSGSSFDDSTLTVYSGSCGFLTEIDCNDDNDDDLFSLISLTGQTPGATLYIGVWKYDLNIGSGDFQISAYDPVPPANDNCSGAIPLTVGSDFASGAVTASNAQATTDSTIPSCQSDATDNVWFKVIVPPSGSLKIETRAASGSSFDDSTLNVYNGTCGSLSEIGCNDDDGQSFFSLISLTGQTPGTTLYISVWKYDSETENGSFQISAYDSSTLSTSETSKNTKKIQLSPNPFKDLLIISDISDIKSISVMDISGRLVKTIEKPSSSINLGDLKDGLYLIHLKMDDGTVKAIKTIKK